MPTWALGWFRAQLERAREGLCSWKGQWQHSNTAVLGTDSRTGLLLHFLHNLWAYPLYYIK